MLDEVNKLEVEKGTNIRRLIVEGVIKSEPILSCWEAIAHSRVHDNNNKKCHAFLLTAFQPSMRHIVLNYYRSLPTCGS